MKKIIIVIIALFVSMMLLADASAIKSSKSKLKASKEKIKKDVKKVKKMEKTVKVLMKTSMGDIELELYPDKAPITVANFVTYAKEGFYDGVVFHRVIKNFMIQGGGFDTDGNYKNPTHPPIKNEAKNGLSNKMGTIAMARTNMINSATSQFFINVKDNLFLDHRDEGAGYGYAVFGKVIKGMDVVKKIEEVPTHVNPKTHMQDWPVKDVIINKVIVEE